MFYITRLGTFKTILVTHQHYCLKTINVENISFAIIGRSRLSSHANFDYTKRMHQLNPLYVTCARTHSCSSVKGHRLCDVVSSEKHREIISNKSFKASSPALFLSSTFPGVRFSLSLSRKMHQRRARLCALARTSLSPCARARAFVAFE